ncbi:lysozyme inhibitor LprI family protein [Luteibacter sp. PPL201]|uniref:Lysozyme inhibitor LprI family protein n=1 Tax=Luteibacter sahnii TaxID=3021977 RepID=A0ABT6B9I1_9GAMM
MIRRCVQKLSVGVLMSTVPAMGDATEGMDRHAAIGLRPSYAACFDAVGDARAGSDACLRAEDAYQRARLDLNYRDVMLYVGRSDRATLREEQVQWRERRDATCDQRKPGAPIGPERRACMTYETARRATVLEGALWDVITTQLPDTKNRGLRSAYALCLRQSESPGDRLFCARRELAYQDRRVGVMFERIVARLVDAKRQGVENDQRRWRAYRLTHCRPPSPSKVSAETVHCEVNEAARRATALEAMF